MPACPQCTDPARCENFGVCQIFKHTLPSGSYEQRIKELKPTEVDSMNRLRVEAVKSRDQWREAAMAFEFRAMRVEYVIRLLVAAGHVTQAKVDEAFNIARDFKRADVVTAGLPNKEQNMNERIEEILRNPSVLKTAEGDGYTDDTASKWAWFAHGYDTGMEPFYSIDQIRDAVRSVLAEAEKCRPGSVCSRSIRGLGGCEAGSCEREEAAAGVNPSEGAQ